MANMASENINLKILLSIPELATSILLFYQTICNGSLRPGYKLHHG
jgi:hypothetical protein